MNSVKVLEVEHYTDSTFRLRVERPSKEIRSGQCFNIGPAASGVNREYSMYSSADAPFLDVLIKEVKDGIVSPQLKKLKTGDLVEIDGPYGEFLLKEPILPTQKYLFIASGTGIAPFHSFVKTYPQMDYKILHGIRFATEQYDAKDYLAGRYVPCISKNSEGQRSVRIPEYLKQNPAEPSSIVYLCGNRNMIVDTFELLIAQGVNSDNIFTEVFF